MISPGSSRKRLFLEDPGKGINVARFYIYHHRVRQNSSEETVTWNQRSYCFIRHRHPLAAYCHGHKYFYDLVLTTCVVRMIYVFHLRNQLMPWICIVAAVFFHLRKIVSKNVGETAKAKFHDTTQWTWIWACFLLIIISGTEGVCTSHESSSLVVTLQNFFFMLAHHSSK